MRVAAEKRADGVYVAAGVELIEPERRNPQPLAPGGARITLCRVADLGDRLDYETTSRLRVATGKMFRRPLILKACHCGAAFVGDGAARYCPACERKASRASVHRLRARRQPPLTQQCRQCGAPMTAKRSTKMFCSRTCWVAAHRQRHGPRRYKFDLSYPRPN
jgi:hypothetical protein